MKLLTILIFCFPFILRAQDTCRCLNNGSIFQANRIGTFYFPQGEKFYNLSDAFFKAPYTSEKSASTIFASAPWIGGYIQGELRMACQTYPGPNSLDFNTGPLGPSAEIYPNLCGNFERVWQVSRASIETHIEDFNSDGIIDDSLTSIFSWPAEGNNFFSKYNGFELPASHHGGWAEFKDLNQNGIYEPDLGEYPDIKLKGREYIPEQIMWMVFNDQGIHDFTHTAPLGLEIQLTVYGFNCSDNYVLSNTLFNSYKIINQNEVDIDSLFFGMWADYDLGCSEDDYMGSDSSRNTEFVYNQDSIDGDYGSECTTVDNTYGTHPPIQSMTYLSHPMNSFISAVPPYIVPPGYEYSAIELYHLLSGLWGDGMPISSFEKGYNPGGSYPLTKFLFHGDPRDTTQWAQSNLIETHADPRTVSSVNLETLMSYDSVIIESAYIFHQDSSLYYLEQVGFMQENIDYLLENIDHLLIECSLYPYCSDNDCVWPGDFNHNGIADHYDLLYWGVMKDSLGSKRDGLINWDEHYADKWSLDLPDGFNAKHGDGNGDGMVDLNDLERNEAHFLFTNPYYVKEDHYPPGPQLRINATPIDSVGRIRQVRIRANQLIDNVYGLAFEFEFDTSIFSSNSVILTKYPIDTLFVSYSNGHYNRNLGEESDYKYGFVGTDHKPFQISEGFTFQNYAFGLRLKSGLTPEDIPDSTILRLKNLIALDVNGNDLHIGSEPLVVYKQELTGISDPGIDEVNIYPNPANDLLYVDVPYNVQGEIFNTQGEFINQYNINSTSPIDVSVYLPGIYFLRIPAFAKTFKLAIY